MGKRKIIVKFSLCEPQKAELGKFLREHLDQLNAKDPNTKAKLISLIKGTDEKPGVFPKEALAELEKTLKADSEYAFLIRNLPENEAVDFGNMTDAPRKPENSIFSYHIGTALYEMFGAEQKAVAFAIRKNPRRAEADAAKKAFHTGTFIHRDFAGIDQFQGGKATNFVSLSAPLDDEHAPTDIFFLEDALKAIPPEIRERTKAHVEFRQIQSFDEDAPLTVMTLQQILDNMLDPVQRNSHTISVVDARNKDLYNLKIANDPADIQLLADSVACHSDSVVLGKGSLLVFCEDRIFHQGNPGDPDKIRLIPPTQHKSRVLLHNSGVPLQR